jgi:hypothetical protein
MYSGIKKKAEHNQFGIILLVDSTFRIPLSSEIKRLEADLFHEGWTVSTIYAGRNESVGDIKKRLRDKNNDMGLIVQSVFIIGHVPVPYSGDFKRAGYPPPDGHVEGSGNHTGAWAADVFYSDLDNGWTDNSVNNTTGNLSRNHNIPGDGKFDQTVIPSALEMELGRVDMHGMTRFSKSDTVLLREYLNKNHEWRSGNLSVIERGLIDDNFAGLNLSSTGWHNISTMVHRDSLTERDYFDSQKNGSFLWSYGCGAGSYTSCRNVGNTTDFVNDSLENIYTILAGSYFGDWDINNNLLKASLANGSMAVFWGGIPKWYVHTMAWGKHIGFGAKVSVGNKSNTDYFTGNFNGSAGKIHSALLGDPSLKMRYFKPATNLTASSSNNQVELSWTASTETVEGYFVYRYDSSSRFFIQLNTNPIQGTSFTDVSNQKSGNHTYMVRAMRIETTPSGSYENLSIGSSATVSHIFVSNLAQSPSLLEQSLTVFPNPNSGDFVLRFISEAASVKQVKIYNTNGALVWENEETVELGNNQVDIQTNLPVGVYFVTIQESDANPIMRKLVISKY